MKKLLATGLGLMFISGAVFSSESTSVNMSKEFIELDADKSGSLSQAETKENAIISKNFANLDSDKDGSLSNAELNSLNAMTQAN